MLNQWIFFSSLLLKMQQQMASLLKWSDQKYVIKQCQYRLPLLVMALAGVVIASNANANTNNANANANANNHITHMHNQADRMEHVVQQDLSQISVTPHELAFLQVLSEICPSMLNHEQKRLFFRAYNEQLIDFIPNVNTSSAMMQISSQREYKRALDWARTWTKSFPYEENYALCVEFAESVATNHNQSTQHK